MFPIAGSIVDFVHALLMAGWVLGLPLLFWRRHARLTRGYAVYAVVFIVLSQLSRLLLGECFLTSLSRRLWEHGGALPRSAPSEWFTVRLAMAVFHLAPSHRSITVLSEALVFVTALGMLIAMRRVARRGQEAAAGGATTGPHAP